MNTIKTKPEEMRSINPINEFKRPIVIAFGTSKGGAGKSTLTQLLAYDLSVNYKYKICVLDIDPQGSIKESREEDAISLAEEEGITFDEARIKLNKEHYTVIASHPKYFSDIYEDINEEFDVIIADFPGSTAVEGVVEAYMDADIVIVPLQLSTKDFRSTIKYLDILNGKEGLVNIRKEHGRETLVRWLPTKVELGSIEYTEYIQDTEVRDTLLPGVKPLKSFVPLSRPLKRIDSTTEDISSIQDNHRALLYEIFDEINGLIAQINELD